MDGLTHQNVSIYQSLEIKSPDCAICRGTLGSNGATVKTVCNHTFDAKCLATWQRINNICPICSTGLSKRSSARCKLTDFLLAEIYKGNPRSLHKAANLFNMGIKLSEWELHDTLLWAIQREDNDGYATAALLIRQGADLTGPEKNYALLSSLSKENFCCEQAKLLIALGATLTQQDLHDLLLVAVREETNSGRADLLISLGARLTQQELHDALLWAIKRTTGNHCNTKLLLKLGATLTLEELRDTLVPAVRKEDLAGLEIALFLIVESGCENLQELPELHDVLLSVIRTKHHLGPRFSQLLTNLGIRLTRQELHDNLLAAFMREDMNGYHIAKLLIGLGAKLSQQELHDTLLSVIQREDGNVHCYANLLISEGARLNWQEQQDLHDDLLSAIIGGPNGRGFDYAELLWSLGVRLTCLELQENLLTAIKREDSRGRQIARLLINLGAELNAHELNDNLLSALHRQDADGNENAELLISMGARLTTHCW